MISKNEVINNLYKLIADVNAEEIASHIKFESLQDWSDTWRCRAKELLMMLEDEPQGLACNDDGTLLKDDIPTEVGISCFTCVHNGTGHIQCQSCDDNYSSYETQTVCKYCAYGWWNGVKYECPFEECRWE